jgi:hypothetical protein
MARGIRIIHWGLGAMGSGMVEMVASKTGLVSVGGIARTPAKVGRDLGEVCGLARTGANVRATLAEVLEDTDADVVLHATASFTRDVFKDLEECMSAGLDVVTIAEEMAYPWVREPELARQIDILARKHGVRVLGTGINPGFVLDTLILALTGVCMEVRKIRAARINDLSPFGPMVMKTQGVGTTPEQFEKGVAEGTIVGHVGFPESMGLIAHSLGWKVDEIRQTREPIISKVYRETPHIKVGPGMVAGCRHVAHGFMGGVEVITLEHPQQVHPHLEGVETGDYIWIEGVPNLNVSNKPEVPGGIGTMAVAVNMIPLLSGAEPGLLTMADLPVPRAILGEVAAQR